MKKSKRAFRQKITGKKTACRQAKNKSRHLRIIPWTMAALAAFYFISLIAIIRFYPEIFSVPSSYAEDQVLTTNNVSVEQQALPDVDAIKSKLKSVVNSYEGKIIKEDFTIEFLLSKEYISRIDFLLKKRDATGGASFPAEKKDGDKWISRIKIADLGNGEYYLFSKIRADFPFENIWSYETPKVPVVIKKPEVANQDTSPMDTGDTQADTGTQISTSDTTATTQTDGVDEDIDPEHKFLEPRNGASISGKREIAGAVSGAGEVEYYLIKKGSLTEKYLGKARKVDAGKWKLGIDTLNIPNGEYKLFPKISNRYGKYKGAAIIIFVHNEIAINASSEKNLDENEAKETKKEIQEENKEEEASGKNETIAGSLSKEIDTDQDGISDEDEKRIGTDPNSADTDKDGYMDGDEVKNGYDPLKSAKDGPDKIVFENPKEKGEVKSDLIKIESVESAPASTGETSDSETAIGFQLKGKGLSNSFITLYVYSEIPTIVTVMTDENGNWTYTMDKSIDDGKHEAYVAITDNEGRITAKSEPFFFVKTAQAVTKASAEDIAARSSAAVQSPVAASRSKQMAVIGFIIIISLFTSIACIGLYLVYHYHHKKEPVIQKDFLARK